MLTIGQMISAMILTMSSNTVSPAYAVVPEDVCGKGTISASSECEILSGDACTEACDAADWSGYCSDQCCERGANFGEYGECDPKCVSACEYNSWGDCSFNWCGSSNVLFCDGQPKATNGELDTCLDFLCGRHFDVSGLVCESPEQVDRKSKR